MASVTSSTFNPFQNDNTNKQGKLGGAMDKASTVNKNVAGTAVGVGNIVAKAAGALGFKGLANALTGTTEIKYNPKKESNGLKEFYDVFSGQSTNLASTIDTYNTFTCEMTFFPNSTCVVNTKKVTTEKKLTMENEEKNINYHLATVSDTKMSDASVDYNMTTISRLLDQIHMINRSARFDIEFNTTTTTENGEDDIVYAGRKGNEGWVRKTSTKTSTSTTTQTQKQFDVLFLDILIQKVNFPTIETEDTKIQTNFGVFPIPGTIVKPSDNTFTMDILNLRTPVIENIFYPWLRETTLPKWSYESQPYATANMTFDFTEHANIKYHFLNCRPISIYLVQPTQNLDSNMTRQVQFAFDFLAIETTDKITKGAYQIPFAQQPQGKKNGSSLAKIANSALFSAANTFKL